ncbi:hypothetical protein ['Camptotheca acuminata' phytoplasma]|uniref:hypothetical protein n=1 Tax='Camptotheca acuminata' phytoplasma TaxID=3239192 RepID=UPI00351A91E0
MFWHLPLILMCLLNSVYINLFYLFIYAIINTVLFSGRDGQLLFDVLKGIKYIKIDEFNFMIKNHIFGKFLFILTYSFVPLFINLKTISYKKYLNAFLFVILFLTLFKTINGYISFYDWIKPGIINILKIDNPTKPTVLTIILIFNFVPILVSNTINFVLIYILNKRLKTTYELYF